MDDVIREMVMIITSYVGIIVIGFALINFLSAGFLIKFIQVRASRGKKILIKVRSATDHYYKVGMISEKTLKYTARGQKEKKTIALPKEQVLYRSMAVNCIDIDEDTNAIIRPDGMEVGTYDAEKYEQLVQRALYKPALMDKNEKIMLVMIAVAILGVLILFFYVKQIDGNIYAMQEQLSSIKDIASKSIGVVG